MSPRSRRELRRVAGPFLYTAGWARFDCGSFLGTAVSHADALRTFEQELDAALLEGDPQLSHSAFRARLLRVFEADQRSPCNARFVPHLFFGHANPGAGHPNLRNVNQTF